SHPKRRRLAMTASPVSAAGWESDAWTVHARAGEGLGHDPRARRGSTSEGRDTPDWNRRGDGISASGKGYEVAARERNEARSPRRQARGFLKRGERQGRPRGLGGTSPIFGR